MGIYLLVAAAAALAGIVGFGVLAALFRLLRRAVTLAHVAFDVEPDTAGPGQPVTARAQVTARGGRKLTVEATLTCTMFDHRAHTLYARTVTMSAANDVFTATLTLPRTALRTGVVGDELSTLFSEDARRLLVSWSIVYTVRSTGHLLLRRAIPLEVESGQALATDRQAIDKVVVDTFAEIKDDLLFNWLVKLAARDGQIAPGERELLHEVLRGAHAVTTDEEADARIAAELEREVAFDAALLRRHVPAATRLSFYKLLYAVAWRDGALDKREHAFLAGKLAEFGLSRTEVREIEREVLRGIAQRSLA